MLEGFVRIMFRVMNADQQISAEQLMIWAEDIKSQYEQSLKSESAAYQSAAVDKFFNSVIRDLRKDAGQT